MKSAETDPYGLVSSLPDLWPRGPSLKEYLASDATTPGVISLVMFLLFAAIPALVALSTRRRG